VSVIDVITLFFLRKRVSAVRQEGRTDTRVNPDMPPTAGDDAYLISKY